MPRAPLKSVRFLKQRSAHIDPTAAPEPERSGADSLKYERTENLEQKDIDYVIQPTAYTWNFVLQEIIMQNTVAGFENGLHHFKARA